MRFNLSNFGIVTGTPAGNTGTATQADFNARMDVTIDQEGVGNVVADFMCGYKMPASWVELALGIWRASRTDSGHVYRYTWGMAAVKAVYCPDYGKTAGQLWREHIDGLLGYWPERLANPDMVEPWYFAFYGVAKAKGLMSDNQTVLTYAVAVAQAVKAKTGRVWPVPYNASTLEGRKKTADSWLMGWGGSTDPNADCVLAHVKWFFYHFRVRVPFDAAALKWYAEHGLNMAGGPLYYEYYIDRPPNSLVPVTKCRDDKGNLIECEHFVEIWPFKFEKGVKDEHQEWVRTTDWDIVDDLWTTDRDMPLFVGGEGADAAQRRVKVRDLPWFLINYPFLQLRSDRAEAATAIMPPSIGFNESMDKAYLLSWAYQALYSGYNLDTLMAQKLAVQAAGVVLALQGDTMVLIGKIAEFVVGAFVKMVETLTAPEPDYSEPTKQLHTAWDAQIADIEVCAATGGTWNIDACIAAVKAELDQAAACGAKGWIWDGVANTCTKPVVGTAAGNTVDGSTDGASNDSIAGYLLLGVAAFLLLQERK